MLACASGVILQERSRSYYWEGSQGLSIKTFTGGQALYDVGQGRYAVGDEAYLVLNQQQPYAISITSPTLIESFCIFFAPNFAEEVQRSTTATLGTLLATPDVTSATPHFFERTYPHDGLVSPHLKRLRTTLRERTVEPAWLDEQLHGLMQQLLQAHHLVCAEVQQLSAVRASTREELYRRVHQARDYAAALYHTPITLTEMAQVACLSPNHFLRTFRQVFQQTPHQFLTAKRLATAQHLLIHTDQPITQICTAVGFASLGSFSWLFHRHVGLSPAAYRQQKGDFQEAQVPQIRHTMHSTHHP